MAGRLLNKDALMLRVACGTATLPDGTLFEINTLPGGSPHITCVETGAQWVISWQELIALAVQSGIKSSVIAPASPSVAFTETIEWLEPHKRPDAEESVLITLTDCNVIAGWFDGECFRDHLVADFGDYVVAWAKWPEGART